MSSENENQAVIDTSDDQGALAATLREVKRLDTENATLKARNIRIWSYLIIVVLLLGFIIVAFVQWFPKYRYIPTKDNAAICEVGTENAPRVSPATLTEFAKDAVVNAYSYDYINYRDRLNEVSGKWFTFAGRHEFNNSIQESGNLERVIKGRLILRAMATKVPQLEEEGVRGTTKYWIVRVPIAIEFYFGGEQQPRSRQEFLAAVTIVQMPASATNLKGIAVDSIALAPYISKQR